MIKPFGLFEFPFMSFGLRNAAETFQRFIDGVLRDLNFCYAYIDDVLVVSTSEREHKQHLRTFFQRLIDYGEINGYHVNSVTWSLLDNDLLTSGMSQGKIMLWQTPYRERTPA